MLPRTLQRSLTRLTHTKRACDVCACRCGANFRSQSFSTSTLFAARQAPGTWRSDKQPSHTPLGARKANQRKKELEQCKNQERFEQIQNAFLNKTFGKSAEQVDQFLEQFAVHSKNNNLRIGAAAPASFMTLVEEHEMTEQDLLFLAMMMLRNKKSETDRYWGRKLMDMLSAAGFVEATIRIMNNALVASKQRPGLLRNAGIAAERGRLQKIAREGTNSRAMVLEGKIAYLLGDSDTAIKLWWKAIDGAVTKGDDMLSRRATGEKPVADISALDRSDLSTPWIELIEAHFDRSNDRSRKRDEERDLCKKAIEIGVEQDDPTAFYYAASFYKKTEDGVHVPTSHWLYHMTKAAASGVPKAAHELGVYYAESGWKYIEDEPPAEMKPTPFDSYPAEGSSESMWDRVTKPFQSRTPRETDTKSDVMFHLAAWPSTPLERLKLAESWLNIAMGFNYAPSFLYRAKLSMQETLWSGAQAPKEALDLDPKRYLYVNKGEWDDAEFSQEFKTWEPPADAVDPPNPLYDLEKAQKYLLRVVIARIAVIHRADTLKLQARKLSQSDVEWEDIESSYDKEKSWGILQWFAHPDVYDMWEKDSLALYNEVADICDQQQWTLYDDSGALCYKHGQPRSSVAEAERRPPQETW